MQTRAHALSLTRLLRLLARRGGGSLALLRFVHASDEEAGRELAAAMWELGEVDRRWAARLIERLYSAVRANPEAIWPWLD